MEIKIVIKNKMEATLLEEKQVIELVETENLNDRVQSRFQQVFWLLSNEISSLSTSYYLLAQEVILTFNKYWMEKIKNILNK